MSISSNPVSRTWRYWSVRRFSSPRRTRMHCFTGMYSREGKLFPMDDITMLIPAYNPTERLIGIVRGLAESGFASIVVVNDGSDASCDPLFYEEATIGQV